MTQIPPTSPPTPVKPGIQTTEFWVTVLTAIGALYTFVEHKTLNWDVQAVAASAAGIASSVYSISRAKVKSAAS